MITPAFCSTTQWLCLAFDYVISKPNSELRVLTRCGGHDWGDQTVFNTPVNAWQKANLTLAACPDQDTEVGIVFLDPCFFFG